MCLAIYVGTSEPVTKQPWNSESPGFYVDVVGNREADVRKNLSKPHICYVGAHEGCGCGFILSGYEEDDELKLTQESRLALTGFLNNLVRQGKEVEMLICWEGEESNAPMCSLSLTPDCAVAYLDGDWKNAVIRLISAAEK